MNKHIKYSLLIIVCLIVFIISGFFFDASFSSEVVNKELKIVASYGDDVAVDDMDTVTFGMYPQSDENGNVDEPIEWIILDKKEDKVLILSKYILDCKCYNNRYESVAWKDCSLRKWLNNDFYMKAFNKDEQERIQITSINDSVRTNDKIFCLSDDEIFKYFNYDYNDDNYFDKRLVAKSTNYSKKIDNYGTTLWVNLSDKSQEYGWIYGSSMYWLRSSGSEPHYAKYISFIGSLSREGDYVDNCSFGVRPALWIKK